MISHFTFSAQVGKISSYDPLSGKVMLVPVPEYPLVLDEKKDEAVELLSINTLYNEDGTLEVLETLHVHHS